MERFQYQFYLIHFNLKAQSTDLSNTRIIKASISQEARGNARERGGVGPCGEKFSAGLIFLCFVSFHLRKRNEEAKKKQCRAKVNLHLPTR